MPTYLTNDGETIQVAGAHELLQYLFETSRSPAPNLKAFKEELMVRVEQQTGRPVLTSDEDLVEGLITTGLITIVE